MRRWQLQSLLLRKQPNSVSMRDRSGRRDLSIDVTEIRSILKNKGVVRIFVIFQGRPVFSHITEKVSATGTISN